ncbi:MAG TPA: bifunctional riboflavin kinase/FAD synthetase [Clostridiaceae bacterium]|nr:bifunctional riboflavin kinase/FAD synthetase [Clostridiaceae bacterium]
MKIIKSSPDEKPIIDEQCGVGLGMFDGLHIGHMALINTLVNESRLLGLKSVVYTFSSHPENILSGKAFNSLITLQDKKVELLSETKVDYLYFEDFNESYCRMSPEEFVTAILLDKLGMKLAVAGFNYRFGHKGQGDVNELKRLGEKYGFKVIIIPKIKINNEVVSSTLIRGYIKSGKMDRVFELLGRHYSITGKVTSGKKIGSQIGFPTANIEPDNALAIPPFGVYITVTIIDGVKYNSITNIGLNPTVGVLEHPVVETHILNFDGDLYDKKIEVFFIAKLRGEKTFKNKSELKKQICMDIDSAKKYFSLNASTICL